jgi:dephospho-CoA kinase
VKENTPLFVIGLAGGIASGKSLVASCFEHFGAAVLDADRIGHEILKEPDVIAAIVSRWGQIVTQDGEIDRSALARIVFGSGQSDSSELEHLEAITHPRIHQRICERLKELTDDFQVVVLDAPVMFKSGWDQLCDKIVFVDADESIRQQRANQRGWDACELSKREANQTPIAEKRSRSSDFIDNSKSKEETYIQARELWRKWNLNLEVQFDSPNSLFHKTTPHTKN